ncbi:MAG: hypothetical protein K1X89_19430, partial [Myxococcaceae bacterium]|nr:hypothetical protein [Myxococcaceae bacterium]
GAAPRATGPVNPRPPAPSGPTVQVQRGQVNPGARAPSQQGMQPVPSAPQRAPSQQGMQPVPQGYEPEPTGSGASAPPRRSIRPAMALGAGVLLTLVGFGVGMLLRGSGPAVTNLEPGETLYIQGVEVDPAKVSQLNAGDMLAITRDGKLTKLGRAAGPRMDARSLISWTGNGATPPGRLALDSQPRDCSVRLGGKGGDHTPFNGPIESGVAIDLEVACPNSPLWKKRLVAAPNQIIDLVVNPTAG